MFSPGTVADFAICSLPGQNTAYQISGPYPQRKWGTGSRLRPGRAEQRGPGGRKGGTGLKFCHMKDIMSTTGRAKLTCN